MRFKNTKQWKPVDRRWQEGRRQARRTNRKEQELSEPEQLFLDIGEDSPYPCVLDRQMLTDGYRVRDSLTGETYDYRQAHPYIGGPDHKDD